MRFKNKKKNYAKAIAENVRKEMDSLEIELKHLETDLKNYQTNLDFKSDEIYSKKADGVRMRSKCDCYKSGVKFNKFFLNLEKIRASEGLIRNFVKNEKEINDPVEINTEFQEFYEKVFTDNLSISKRNVVSLFEDLPVPKLHEEQIIKCEGEITESELLKSLKSMKNYKSLGNDGLTKEIY